jgi:hypothetical protein
MARAITTAVRVMATGAKRAMATTATTVMMATMATILTTATMMPNGEDDNKNQAATATRVITMVARATVIGAKWAMAMMATTATTATKGNNGDNGEDGNNDAKQQRCRQWG